METKKKMKIVIKLSAKTPIDAAQETLHQVETILTHLRDRYTVEAAQAARVKDLTRSRGAVLGLNVAIEWIKQIDITSN